MASNATGLDLPLDLPSLPDNWHYQPLAQLVDEDRGIRYGIVQPGSPAPNGIPIIRVNDIRNGRISDEQQLRVTPDIESKYPRTRLRGGEVLLTLVGTVGETAIVPECMVGWNVARAVAVLPLNGDVSASWVNLCLRSAPLQHYIRIWCTTTVQATFNLRDVARLPIPIPPKPERERITHIFGTLDDKIELNRRMNETLEAMARRLFRSWFIDFDPVNAKATLRREHPKLSNADLSRRALPSMAPEIAELFPDSFEESTHGQIPKGWKAGTVSDIGDNPRRGVQPSDIPAATPYIALEHMPRRCIALSDWGNADDVASGKFHFNKGEILFGKLRPYFHKVGVPAIDGVCSTDVLVIVPNENHWFGVLLGHVSSDEMISHTDTSSTGTKMPRTNWGDIGRFPIAVPTKDIAMAATTQIAKLVNHIHANICESRTLARTRNKLLPRLLSGDLTVTSDNNSVGASE